MGQSPINVTKGDQPPVGANQDDLWIKQSDGTLWLFNGKQFVPAVSNLGGTAGGALTGTYPNPTIASGATLTTPVIVGSGGTLTLPAGPDTLVARATTDTLTNKTLSAPVITGGVTVGGTIAGAAAADMTLNTPSGHSIAFDVNGVAQWVLGSAGGLYGGGATGADKGTGTINATTLYQGGNQTGSVLLADTLLGIAATNITFSSIPGTFKHLQLVIQSRGDGAVTSEAVNMQFNGDTAGNYDTEFIQSANATVSGGNAVAATSISGGLEAGASSAANTTGFNHISIPNYAATTFNKIAFWEFGLANGTAAQQQIGSTSGQWRSTAAITSIKLFPASSTNFVTGTRATLYGLN